ncbi:hypothetical protein AYO38_11645 [bacterium SCGC AG-212-C10]|nr:hypothetical protein AYO38_11645 [bacterium SCGC AG-212-C10]
MAAVIAGWFAGYIMGTASTIMLTVIAFRLRARGTLDRFLSDEVNPVLVSVPIFLGATIGWTMIGLILGSGYEVLDLGAGKDAFGSPSAAFTIAMVGFAWIPVPVLIAFSRRLWWMWVSMALLFAGLFGWMLPHLAGQ